MSETAQTATQNIDVVATTEKVLKKVDSMSFDAILNDYMIPYGKSDQQATQQSGVSFHQR